MIDPCLGMKLTPWNEIWTAVRTANRLGQTSMIQSFYDVLFKVAVFDDRGAWILTGGHFMQ